MLHSYKGNDSVAHDDLPDGTVLMIERSVSVDDDTPKNVKVTCVRKLTQEEMDAAGLAEWKEL